MVNFTKYKKLLTDSKINFIDRKKISYYFRSLRLILFNIENPLVLLFLFIRRRVVLKLKNGLLIEIVNPIDFLVIKETIIDDAYKLLDLCKANLIIDIGAAFGDFAILAAKKFPTAQILAFEPDKAGYLLLIDNIKRNKLTNIKSFSVAIGHGQVSFEGNRGVKSSIYEKSKDNKKINLKNLSNFIKNKKVDLLKIDCEGAELNILESVGDKLRDVKKIALEYHNHLVKNEDLLLKDLLIKNNFKVQQKKDPYNPNIGYIYASNKLFLD